jgi:hypothetical protein
LLLDGIFGDDNSCITVQSSEDKAGLPVSSEDKAGLPVSSEDKAELTVSSEDKAGLTVSSEDKAGLTVSPSESITLNDYQTCGDYEPSYTDDISLDEDDTTKLSEWFKDLQKKL